MIWPVEQHLNRSASIRPCPALLLAAIAERTRTLRLGTPIVQLSIEENKRLARRFLQLVSEHQIDDLCELLIPT